MRTVTWVLLGLWTPWVFGALVLGGSGPTLLRTLMAVVLVSGVLLVASRVESSASVVAAVWLVVTLGYGWRVQPSHDRDWAVDQARLPGVSLRDDGFTLQHQRAFRYRSVDDFEPAWTTQEYRYADLVGADLGVEQFSTLTAVAHTFVCFRFRDGRVLAVSVEIRKEKGETFSPVRGLFRQYEKMIVFGDERDLIELRAVHRQDETWLFPMEVDRHEVERFLRSVLAEAEAIERSPVFYNTLTASCSTSLGWHLRQMGALGWDPRQVLPGYVDAMAHDAGWLGAESLQQLRERHRINARAIDAAGTETFSERIRSDPRSVP